MKTIAVIGAGTMGSGIAQACAAAGLTVRLYDQDHTLALKALQAIRQQMDIQVSKGKINSNTADEVIKAISVARTIDETPADLVIEAVAENLAIKQSVFASLERINAPDTPLTSNTASISVTAIASTLKHPERFAGLHFFNPAPVMKLVEIVYSPGTAENTLTVLQQFCRTINKHPVTVQDSPGFIVNRVARPFYLESLRLLEEGIADARSIDTLLRTTGFRMGPFELMDLIGLDVNLAVSQSLYTAFDNTPRFRPSTTQERKVDAGELGRKTGKG